MGMRIRITGFASRQSFLNEMFGEESTEAIVSELSWYKDKIGAEYPVSSVGSKVFFVHDDVSSYATVDKADAAIVE